MTETRDIREKRLMMRSMRRGIKEMDLILQDFATRELRALSKSELDIYETLLEQNDLDVFKWVNGQETPPEEYNALISKIKKRAVGLVAPKI